MGKINCFLIMGAGVLFLVLDPILWGSYSAAFFDDPLLIFIPIIWIILGAIAWIQRKPDDPWFGDKFKDGK